MSKDAYIIIVDRATAAELNAVHEIVKGNSAGWWHRFANTWFVFGRTAPEWRSLVKPALTGEGSSVLVVLYPAESGGKSRWSFSGPDAKARCKWLHEHLPDEVDSTEE